ncbi:M20/M25/M40 family metallo-hydrolase [Pacificimonas sp. WHA3]|uniref:M20/M25/M40 family metallo-hydrolase n=1 Tax=Pacificimonas pallii TaxID=2827236 RepID=A0ABS6SEL3_9SPHN|nr:M20/M25/M40 family metallo-hydrolase [Pacificimonas pallii]MBV7256842.1 M20/M25/M40 family metallo-hydrolase [Pacificimonas pallii]
MRKYLGLLAAVSIALILAIVGTTPPSPRDETAPQTDFSAARAMVDVRQVAAAPHVTGSAENARVRAYLVERLRALGLDTGTTASPLGEQGAARLRQWRGDEMAAPPVENIFARLGGSDPSLPAVLLMAHYDSVWGSAGASDDAAGVAAILEIVRAVKAKGALPRDLLVLFTDAEELGLEGAKYFFANNSNRRRVGAIINLEARGGGGRTTLFQTSAQNGEAMRLYHRAVDRPGASSLAAFVYSVLPNDTDLTPALSGDYTAYNFAFIGRPGLYHSPDATPENLDQGALQDMGAQGLDLTWALLSAETLPGKAADLTFFDMFGLFLISYPAWAGWLLIAAAALLVIDQIRAAETRKTMARGSAATLLVILLGAGLLYLFNLLSGADGAINYYDRLAATTRLEVQALLICAAMLVLALAWLGGQRASLIGIILAIVVQLFAPTAAYIIVIPLLLGGLAAVAKRRVGGGGGIALAVLFAAISLGFLFQNSHALMQGVGPAMPMVAALLAALALPPLTILAPPVSGRAGNIIAAFLLIAALALALWVRLDPVAETVAVYSEFRMPR